MSLMSNTFGAEGPEFILYPFGVGVGCYNELYPVSADRTLLDTGVLLLV